FPVGRFYNYSNMGFGLLALAMERASGESYERLLQQHLLDPLGMGDTMLHVRPGHSSRVAVGYSLRNGQVRERDWDMESLSAAGGLFSTVDDLARFLALHMQAGRALNLPIASGSLTELQIPQRLLDTWDQGIGLGWHIRPMSTAGDVVWHTGALGGYTSYMAFSGRHDVGVIILTNRHRSVERYGHWLLRQAIELYGDNAPARPALIRHPTEEPVPDGHQARLLQTAG
ncbi:MAG TPA: serine hydrolase domain-containing protein, partial [Thioalkalivibrio sp.]|nr:serine hydrolase domain-containing protein [Thioalkalivibrio sp.]